MAAGDVEANVSNINAKAGAKFDGVDDYVEVDNFTNLQNLTLSVWVLANKDIQHTGLLDKYEPTGSKRSWRWSLAGSGEIEFYYSSDGASGFSVTSNNNSGADVGILTHLTLVKDGTLLTYYKNGVAISTDTLSFSELFETDVDLYIGRERQNAIYFDGLISDIKIFNKALTTSEVMGNYQGQNIKDGLINRYKLATDYKDSVGTNDGTNSGSILTIADDAVSADIAADRVTANDTFLMTNSSGQIITSVIEEAP